MKTPRKLVTVVGLAPRDDGREGLEDALEGRPHGARRKGGDEFRYDQFRDRVADCQLMDLATGGIAQKQGVGLHHLSRLVGATALLPAGGRGSAPWIA